MKKSFPVKPKGTDTVPIMATPGEFVMNRGAVAAAGKPFLDYLNQLGKTHPAMMTQGGSAGKSQPVRYMALGGLTSGANWPSALPRWMRFIPPVRAGVAFSNAGNRIADRIQNAGANKSGGSTGGTDWSSVKVDPSLLQTTPIPISNQGVPVSDDNIPTVETVRVPLDEPSQDSQDNGTTRGRGGFTRIANIEEGDRPRSIFGADPGGRIASFAGPGFAAGENIPGGGAFGTNFESLGFGSGGGGFFNLDPSLSRRIGFQEGGEVPVPQPQRYYDRVYDPEVMQFVMREKPAPEVPEQERPEGYAQAMKYPGIIEAPTMDLDGPEASGTFEFDGKYYVLPTQIDGQRLSHEEATARFRQTGEHLGMFTNENDAQGFEKSFLGYVPPPAQSAPSATPQGYQGGGIVRGRSSFPIQGILRGIGNAIQDHRRRQYFSQLAAKHLNPVFQPQRKPQARGRAQSPFAMRG